MPLPVSPHAFPFHWSPGYAIYPKRRRLRHDSNCRQGLPSPVEPDRGVEPMTFCIPLVLACSAVPPFAALHDPGHLASPPLSPAVSGRDRSGIWLRNAAAGLCVLAAAAAAVSFTAQYRLVDAVRHL